MGVQTRNGRIIARKESTREFSRRLKRARIAKREASRIRKAGGSARVERLGGKDVLIQVEKPEQFVARTAGGTIFAQGSMFDIETAARKKQALETSIAKRDLRAAEREATRKATRAVELFQVREQIRGTGLPTFIKTRAGIKGKSRLVEKASVPLRKRDLFILKQDARKRKELRNLENKLKTLTNKKKLSISDKTKIALLKTDRLGRKTIGAVGDEIVKDFIREPVKNAAIFAVGFGLGGVGNIARGGVAKIATKAPKVAKALGVSGKALTTAVTLAYASSVFKQGRAELKEKGVLTKTTADTIRELALLGAGGKLGDKAAPTVVNANKLLLRSKGGKARLTPSFKKSKRIIAKIKKAPSKAALRKAESQRKVSLEPKVKVKDFEPVRAFSVKTKGDKITGIELGKGKKQTRTTFKLPKKITQRVTKTISRDVPIGGGQVAKKLLRVQQVQKIARQATPTAKLSLKTRQQLQQRLTGKQTDKTKFIKTLVGSVKQQQKTFAVNTKQATAGFRSQKAKDALLAKLRARQLAIEAENNKATKAFIKGLNKKLKTKSSTVSEATIKKVAKDTKQLPKLAKQAKAILSNKEALKQANSVATSIKSLGLVRFAPGQAVSPLGKIKPKDITKPKDKTTPITKPRDLVISKIAPVAKTVAKPKRKAPRKLAPKIITKPKKVAPIKRIVRKFKLRKVVKPKPKPIKIVKKVKRKVSKIVKPKKLKQEVVFFTPTIVSPRKKKKDTKKGKKKEKISIFTGLEFR